MESTSQHLLEAPPDGVIAGDDTNSFPELADLEGLLISKKIYR
jgi:hypothetical protein